jgi:RNA polymerase sigma-70 factor (ECF subfamily)
MLQDQQDIAPPGATSGPETEPAGLAPSGARSRSDAQRWLDEHGDILWRFVVARVRSAEVAEEIVQETFVAALASAASFQGESSERTWLLGIAAHKVGDFLRRRARATHRADRGDDDPCQCDVCRTLFSAAGMWARNPGEWSGSGDPSENRALRRALVKCMDALPPAQREAMWMRDVLAVPAAAICKEFRITATNLWTRLHRARSAVRSCLEGKLGDDAAGAGRRRGDAGGGGP